MHRSLSKRGKVAATVMTMLLITMFVASFTPKATATPTTITLIDPEIGHVGDIVRIIGEINTTNGLYRVFFDEEEVKNGMAVDRTVNDTFVVPHRPMGNHTLKLHDVITNTTDTKVFTVQTAYYVEAVVPPPPKQLQESDLTEIWVNVTGGTENTCYWANITVTDPLGTVYYNDTLQLTNTTDTGHGTGSRIYPTDFGAGAHRNYTGVYNLAFNGTLAPPASFTVGLTDKIEYRRMQTVYVKGAGYIAYENVTVGITSVAGYPKDVTAGSNGVVNDSWTIPLGAAVGTYEVALTGATTSKLVPDVQNFTVIETIITILIDPHDGRWGRNVTVTGEIVTPGGSYQIRWDGKGIKNGTCAPGSVEVNDTFTVLPSAKGGHNVTLYDVNQSIESMPSIFNVTTSFCYVSADPTRIQEGLNTTITVTVNEAEPNAALTFTINVTDSQPASHIATLNVPTNATGSGSNSALYYGDFSVGAHTNYTGTYVVAVGAVNEILATGNFSVGLTDRLDYGRTKTERVIVNIRSAGYKPTEVVIINITVAENPIEDFPMQMYADEDGIIIIDWKIPNNATLGIYTVTLTNASATGTIKPVPDVQNFTVTEVIVYCQTQNRYDKEPLAGVSVGAYLGEAYVDSGITNETGWIDLRVSHGNYTFKAFWKRVEIGSLNYIVLGNITLPPLECQLAHLTISISDEAGFPLPFINVTLTSDETGVLQFETNSTGIIKTNTFTNVNYIIEARRYGHVFNITRIENLTVTRWINITCPTYTLFVHVLDSKGLPLQNVEVAVYEWSSEVKKSEITDDLGSAVFRCTFGKYKIWVYDQNSMTVLNKTVVTLIEDGSFFVIYCKIFNVDLSVVVKDYFGNSIPNALVKIERESFNILDQKTGSNGTASFYNIIGGDCRISVSVTGKLCETRTLYLDGTKVIVFKLERYIVVGGYPLETTQLITCISLGILIIAFALVVIYRKLHLRKVHEGEEKEKSL